MDFKNLTPPGFLKNLFMGGGGALINGISNLVSTIEAPKEKRDQLSADMAKEINRHLEAMSDQAHKEMTAYLSDVQDARAMQIEALKQADLFSKRFVYILASAIVILTLGYDFVMLFREVPLGNKDLCNIIAGALNTSCLAAVIGYFFGSSKGSDDKARVLADIAKQPE